jgi:FkbM family methyltransferase
MSKLTIKNYINQLPISFFIKGILEKIIQRNLGLWSGNRYFEKLFLIKKRHRKNKNSLNFKEGVVLGSFENTHYFMKMRPQNLIESNVYIHGVWEQRIAQIIRAVLTSSGEETIMIDVGANIGATSIPHAITFQKNEFYLFEPHPDVYKDLLTNCALNGLKNIKIINSAITSENTEFVDFFAQAPNENMGLSSLRENKDISNFNKIKIKTTKLDDFFLKKLPHSQVKRVGLIKIDTQGTEFDVLKSAKSLIERDRPAIIFEYNSLYQASSSFEKNIQNEIEQFFSELGYGLYCIEDHLNYLPKVKFDGYFSGDIIALNEKSDFLSGDA